IRGKVTDSSTGMPITGASLMIADTQQSTHTDDKGEFSIAVTGNGSSLVVSYIGYTTQTVLIGNKSFVEIRLEGAEEALEEVVVTGYQTQRKKDLTGAVSVVDVSEIMKVPENNPMKALQG